MIKDIRKKGILLVASLLLLLAAGVYMAYAWYTKNTSASDMSFNAARWEYSANFSTEPIELNICSMPVKYADGSEGISIVEGKAAPGTEGFAPIVLSAGESEIAVGYSLSVDKSLMSDEFKERIYFFQDEEMTQPAGDNWGDTGGNGRTVITGILEPGETKTIIIYWRWVYDAAEIQNTAGGKRYTSMSSQEFDAFDTMVGSNPERYKADMVAQVLISGTQVEPGASNAPEAAQRTTEPQETTPPEETTPPQTTEPETE